MELQPAYSADNLKVAYQLRYNWTTWPAESTIFPTRPDDPCFEESLQGWESDGIRVLDIQWSPTKIDILTSVTPQVSPVTFTARMKGRLQYSLKKQGIPIAFSRKVSMNTIGDAERSVIENYIANQVDAAQFTSKQYAEFLKQFTVTNHPINLANPIATKRGRYLFNLHLVLVTDHRMRIDDASWLTRLRDTCLRIAAVKKHRLSTLAIMPDHLHIALGGAIEHSPEAHALSYMNNLTHVLQVGPLWRPSYFVSSFGEYNMHALQARRRTSRSTDR